MQIHDKKIIIGIQEQYGAALEMFKIALERCPVELWADSNQGPTFWQVTHHALYFLDWYMSITTKEREDYKPEFPDTPENFDPNSNAIEKSDLLAYHQKITHKAKDLFNKLTIENLVSPSVFEWHGDSMLSSLLYNLRHFMLHIGTLNYRILRAGIKLDNWVSHKTF